MSGQTWVPSSTTDWCSSGLSRPWICAWPPAKISLMWERSSRVSGSITWNSSSIPIVKLGRGDMPSAALVGARRAGGSPRGRRPPGGGWGHAGGGGPGGGALRPEAGRLQRPRLDGPIHQHLRGVLNDPAEVLLAHREAVAV